jgi:hypothetical protein
MFGFLSGHFASPHEDIILRRHILMLFVTILLQLFDLLEWISASMIMVWLGGDILCWLWWCNINVMGIAVKVII